MKIKNYLFSVLKYNLCCISCTPLHQMKQRFHLCTDKVVSLSCVLQRLLIIPVKIKKSQLIKYPAALLRLGFFIDNYKYILIRKITVPATKGTTRLSSSV